MKPEHFLALMEMAYWELPNSDISPRLCGFTFACSEYYLSAYTNTDEWQEQFSERDGHKGYRVFEELNHEAGQAQLIGTYQEYNDNWSDELREGYELAMRVIEEIRKS
ncbi:hypothetical protein M199_gp209 [Halogranum tailed virus 1]|uniref:Uncharacterized protein n=1 Tax=Halogranum tailed virus 1 TaxID=1273749 RepID=R4TLA2_9CAUD|nr:hypothetical protein M199_gp209 [Halogranum tailed virus 1]AGM11457.1 hypothetical protein HGTV1_160 [Halogranum tailed virus 1]